MYHWKPNWHNRKQRKAHHLCWHLPSRHLFRRYRWQGKEIHTSKRENDCVALTRSFSSIQQEILKGSFTWREDSRALTKSSLWAAILYFTSFQSFCVSWGGGGGGGGGGHSLAALPLGKTLHLPSGEFFFQSWIKPPHYKKSSEFSQTFRNAMHHNPAKLSLTWNINQIKQLPTHSSLETCGKTLSSGGCHAQSVLLRDWWKWHKKSTRRGRLEYCTM